MGKAVLISIQPKWCKLIAGGKKTVEVRKTKPKLKTPFKCYIYCTKDEPLYRSGEKFWCKTAGEFGNGKVIGEFICNKIEVFAANAHTVHLVETERIAHSACIPMDKLAEYGMNTRTLYGWHVSDFVIYDEPKRLSEFFKACDKPKGTDCSICVDRRENKCKAITRAPQSWCYVEANNG